MSNEQSTNDLVIIARAGNLGQAEMLKSALTAEGIQCFVHDEHIGSTFGYTAAIDYIKIKVKTEDALKAREVLGISAVNPEDEPGANVLLPPCPRCGSRRIYQKPRTTFFYVISALLLFIPNLITKKTYGCTECQQQWRSTIPALYYMLSFMIFVFVLMIWSSIIQDIHRYLRHNGYIAY